jgi:hypothetical protein
LDQRPAPSAIFLTTASASDELIASLSLSLRQVVGDVVNESKELDCTLIDLEALDAQHAKSSDTARNGCHESHIAACAIGATRSRYLMAQQTLTLTATATWTWTVRSSSEHQLVEQR